MTHKIGVTWVTLLLSLNLLHHGIKGKLKSGITIPDKPNIVLMVADDMGWGDLCSYGHPTQECGEIDKMAAEGMRFLQWYSADSLCSPSRAALLTGRLPIRVGVWGGERVFLNDGSGGLPKNETTIAEALKDAGYATGLVGKWHLGINEFLPDDGSHLPHHHGFDFVGTNLPFTNHWACDESKVHMAHPNPIKCFLYWNSTLVQQPFRHDNLTASFLQDSVAFMHNHKDRPFFFYFSFAHMHTDMFSAPRFRQTSRRGRYGDGLREMDWAVGEVLTTLVSLQIQHRTLVIFLSDHGGHLEICTEGGSNGILKGGKASTWDGGLRVPGIAWWPGVVAPGQVSHDLVSSMDVFQTAVELAGVTPPTGRIYDGKSLVPILLKTSAAPTSKSTPSPRTLFHYCSNRLMAVRQGGYKAHFYSMELPSNYTEHCPGGVPNVEYYSFYDCYGSHITHHDPPLLFNIDRDPGELYPLSVEHHREIITHILAAKAQHEANLVPGKAQCRETSTTLQPCCNPPFCYCNYKPATHDHRYG
ncbi:PREDICTED: arylsulfatase-like [Branchiostoma belcheri]|uniref:Arylsulfatase-like n=1 Tax=Branchiostoma belcheri TaxID=7741 RepID=A0A6P4YJG1_BRABE|nr:PREDICTED: arylsulfatase-like [Branchiostoma belcheri]